MNNHDKELEYLELEEKLNQEEISEEEDKDQDAEQGDMGRNASLEAELEECKQKAEEYYFHLQRLTAEYDNYRKRTQKEKEDAAKFASEKVILSLLPVLDNFERAVEAAKTARDFDSFSQGVEMILRQLKKVLEDEGLTPIEAVGKGFDPNIHEALMQVESDQDENTVVEELQKGYYLKDKVIRHSKVKVST